LVGQGDLGLEQLNAVGNRLQRCLAGVGWVGQAGLVGSEPSAAGDQHRHRAVLERLADRGRGGDQQRLEVVDGSGPSFAGTPAGGPQDADHLHDPIAALGDRGRDPASAARAAASASIGSDLPRCRRVRRSGRRPRPPHLLVEQVAGQAGTVAAGAFHADHTDLAVAAKPAQQLPVAATISRELLVAEQPSLGIKHGSVIGVTMGVDPADDNPAVVRHAEVAFPLDDRAGQARTGRAGGNTRDKASLPSWLSSAGGVP
jgi:hypothetical protein